MIPAPKDIPNTTSLVLVGPEGCPCCCCPFTNRQDPRDLLDNDSRQQMASRGCVSGSMRVVPHAVYVRVMHGCVMHGWIRPQPRCLETGGRCSKTSGSWALYEESTEVGDAGGIQAREDKECRGHWCGNKSGAHVSITRYSTPEGERRVGGCGQVISRGGSLWSTMIERRDGLEVY